VSRQNIEPRLVFDASDDFDDEIKIGGLVHELAPVVDADVQMLDPRPALTNGGENHLSPGAVEISPVVRLTANKRPSVSTAIWRFRPTIFLAPSKARSAPGAVP
jgi:hypothetical protein